MKLDTVLWDKVSFLYYTVWIANDHALHRLLKSIARAQFSDI